MTLLTQLLTSTFQNSKALTCATTNNLALVRFASKKSGGSTRIKPGHPRPKHRGWKVQDGQFVQAGTLLVTQLRLRFHPGLHVGIGKNGTLFAMEAGKVMVTCEKINPDLDHVWVKRYYLNREGDIYKKHFHVIPEPQHDRFVLIDAI